MKGARETSEATEPEQGVVAERQRLMVVMQTVARTVAAPAFVPSVRQTNLFPKRCYSIARERATAHGLDYVEGFLFPDGVGLSIGHAWNVDASGVHTDWTRGGGARDAYYAVTRVKASEFVCRMSDIHFSGAFELHDLLPFTRALRSTRVST